MDVHFHFCLLFNFITFWMNLPANGLVFWTDVAQRTSPANDPCTSTRGYVGLVFVDSTITL
jgi:hypothetical protein